MKKRVAILISGGGSNMVALVRSMEEQDHPAVPVAVLSNVPGAGGLAKAEAMDLPTLTVDHRIYPDRTSFETAVTEALAIHRADILCLAGFMRILSPSFTERWAGRLLNIHPSLLPKYPGLHTHARALQAGDTEAGCTVHQVTADLDAGPILGQARVPIEAMDTPCTLATRVLAAEHRLYPQVLRRFAAEDPRILYLP